MNTTTKARTCFGCGVSLPLQVHATYTAHEFACGEKFPDKIPVALRPIHAAEKRRQERSRVATLAAAKRADAKRLKANPQQWVFVWDEISNEIVKWEGERRKDENPWSYHSLLANGTVVLQSDRDHFSLETWATDKQHANRKFLEFPPYAKQASK